MRSRVETLSCRTGPLRVVRPLRGGYTGLGDSICFGPTVGRDLLRGLRRCGSGVELGVLSR
jgi:hypothetical protein